MIIEVDTSVLSTDYAETYFTERADRRIMIGLRATLEMLGIPLVVEVGRTGNAIGGHVVICERQRVTFAFHEHNESLRLRL